MSGRAISDHLEDNYLLSLQKVVEIASSIDSEESQTQSGRNPMDPAVTVRWARP